MDGLGETEVVDVTMHMVAQERHFQDMNKTFWEFREKNMYTDLIIICKVSPILLITVLMFPWFPTSKCFPSLKLLNCFC